MSFFGPFKKDGGGFVGVGVAGFVGINAWAAGLRFVMGKPDVIGDAFGEPAGSVAAVIGLDDVGQFVNDLPKSLVARRT